MLLYSILFLILINNVCHGQDIKNIRGTRSSIDKLSAVKGVDQAALASASAKIVMLSKLETDEERLEMVKDLSIDLKAYKDELDNLSYDIPILNGVKDSLDGIEDKIESVISFIQAAIDEEKAKEDNGTEQAQAVTPLQKQGTAKPKRRLLNRRDGTSSSDKSRDEKFSFRSGRVKNFTPPRRNPYKHTTGDFDASVFHQLKFGRPLHHHVFGSQSLGTTKREAHLQRKLQGFSDVDRCKLLVECVRGMSFYDFFVYFHSDEINPDDGTGM